MAAAHLQDHNLIGTAFVLLQVERSCAEELRFNADARRLLKESIAQNSPIVGPEFRSLAGRAGLF